MAAASPFVECGFCLRRNEQLEEPKRLPCGHIHCSSCLQGFLDVKKILKCPDCKKVLREQIHKLPDADLGHHSVQSDCDVCKEKEPAVLYCTDNVCKKKFCLKDAEFHERLHSNHHTINVEEFHRQAKKHGSKVCPTHKDQPLKFGCRCCPKILCEDCLEEFDGCGGFPHQPVKVETIFNELKQDMTKVRDKVEKRKSELSAIDKESDKVLAQYGEETKELVELLHKTREEQIQVINNKYIELERRLIEGRKVVEDKIVQFKEERLEAELFKLKNSFEKIMTGFTQDHMVDVVARGKTPSQKLETLVEKALPYYSFNEVVILVIRNGCDEPKAEISTADINLQIGKQTKKERENHAADVIYRKNEPGDTVEVGNRRTAAIDRNYVPGFTIEVIKRRTAAVDRKNEPGDAVEVRNQRTAIDIEYVPGDTGEVRNQRTDTIDIEYVPGDTGEVRNQRIAAIDRNCVPVDTGEVRNQRTDAIDTKYVRNGTFGMASRRAAAHGGRGERGRRGFCL